MKHTLRLASLSLLTAWLVDIGVCVGIPTLPIQISVKAKRAPTQATESTCKPPLPSLLLQLSPPTADHEALHPLLGQLENTASSAATSQYVDSITVGVVGPQGMIWSKGFGKAKANGTDATPPNEHTIYRVASVSKLFATMEGHVLSEKGIINWDDSVVKHIPNFKYNSQTWKYYIANNMQAPLDNDQEQLDPITLRHLGSHTSGIGRDWPTYNVDEYPEAPPNLPARVWPTLDEQLQAIAETPLIAPPGFLTVYSNTGFSVLGGALVAANSKAEGNALPYSDLLKRDLFGPLGMNGSSFIASPDNAAHLAIPKNPAEVDFNPADSFQPVGGQFSSLSDLANVTRFLLNPPPTSQGGILRASTLREWIRPSYAQYDNATETGLLWEILRLPDSYGRVRRFYGKSGDLSTFHSEVIFNRELQFGLVVLVTGAFSAEGFSHEALPLLLPGFETILEELSKERYAGTWKGNADDEVVVVVEGGVLSITKWKVNGYDFLQLYELGLLDRVSLWSTGKLDEFRIAVGSAGANADPLWGCFPFWATIDSIAAHHAPMDLLYFEGEGDSRAMRFPSANATLHRTP